MRLASRISKSFFKNAGRGSVALGLSLALPFLWKEEASLKAEEFEVTQEERMVSKIEEAKSIERNLGKMNKVSKSD